MRRARSRTPRARRMPVLRRVLLGFYGLLALVFVAGFLARYIHPNVVWWFQIAGIVLPFSGAALALASVAVFASPGRYLWRVHLALLALVVIRFPPWIAYSVTGEPSADDLRILTYNAPGKATEPRLNVAEAMAALVVEAEPHIIALQESFWRYAFGSKRALGRTDIEPLVYAGRFIAAPDSSRRRPYTYQPVFSTIGMTDLDFADFVYSPDEGGSLHVVRVDLEWQDRPLSLYNIHLASYGVQKPWEEAPSGRLNPRVWVGYVRRYRSAILRRAWEAEHVRNVLDSAEGPFILTGDFNATPHNWSQHHISRGLRDAMADAGDGWGFTYHRGRPIARIDFILASPELEFTSARVLNGKVSDHLAVAASARWAAPAGDEPGAR